MAALLRKFFPSATSIPCSAADSDEDFNIDYSIAMEYHGPPVAYDIPHALPIDIHQIPTAAAVASASLLSNFNSLPVIQPIVRTTQVGKKTESKDEEQQEQEVSSSSEISAAEVGNFGGGGGEKSVSSLSERVGSSRLMENVAGFENYMNPENWESTVSGTSSRNLSSDVFSHKEEDCGGESPHHVRKPSVVTFRDVNSDDIVVEEDYDRSEEAESVQERPKAERSGKKGSCYRCNKGNRFTEKEVCFVCGAKYCFNCVLKAMGSMPEGRKCVTCIGYRIDETRRRKLGKCSRVLKRLLTDLEIVQIMKFEISCKVNQLPGNLFFVNEKPLSQEELVRLQSCRNSPRKLKPGSYWYDNMSGLWGKVWN